MGDGSRVKMDGGGGGPGGGRRGARHTDQSRAANKKHGNASRG